MELALQQRERLTNLIKSFRRHRVLVLGDLILDHFVRGTVERISPEAPVPVVVVRQEEWRLGGAANVASNIRSLGGEPLLVGVVSNDEAGERVQHEMENQEMNCSGLLVDLGRPTTVKTRVIAGHQQVCRLDRESATAMSNELYSKALAFIQRQIASTDALLVSDYGKGFINQKLLSAVLPLAQKAEKLIAIDPKNLDYACYRPATVLTPNKKEAEQASGIRISNEQTLHQAAEVILKKTRSENLLITRGEEGMTLFRPTGYTRHIPTFAKEVYDVTGAGDTVIATLALGLAAGGNPEESALLANQAAGLVVGKLGTATVSPEELTAAIRHHSTG